MGLAAGLLLTGCTDASDWAVFTTAEGLPHDVVESVIVDADGTVWAATQAGLARADDPPDANWEPVEPSLPTGERPPQMLTATPDGQVWAASWSGVAAFDGVRWDDRSSGVAFGSVTALGTDGDGRVLAGTVDGVLRFDGDGWERLPDSPSEVTAFATAPDGTVWASVATVSDGRAVHTYDGERWRAHVTRESTEAPDLPAGEDLVPGRVVADVAVDEEGVVWVGSDEGVGSSDGAGWTHHTVEDGLPHAGVRAVAVDRDGDVWAATLEQGVSDPEHAVARFDGDEWSTHTTADGLPDGWVHDLEVGADGTVWAATEAGLAAFVGER